MLSSLFFSLTLFSAVVGQTTISDITDTTEFPYVFRVQLSDQGYPTTFPGFAVSQKYILTSNKAFRDDATLITISDQLGVVYPTPKSTEIAGHFAILRICKKLPGPYVSMSRSSFNNLTASVPDAEFILFKEDDDVLKRVTPLNVLDAAGCEATTNASVAAESICVEINATPDFCSHISDAFGDGSTPTKFRAPAVVIGGQVNAIYTSSSVVGCNSSSVNDQVGSYSSFWLSVDAIIGEIPDGVANP
ncbi:Hypothetical predicted protein [Cloeon dipterum]|uniref:Peptidase S1 domain-containing protein n=1 Tax=Cloeon dipterum TaxID=197152 RepID=A0A8S1DYY9_9INSE|nr:Hypothetical predicted protein [Cloeon dipterum]